jgi:hypothetical protein
MMNTQDCAKLEEQIVTMSYVVGVALITMEPAQIFVGI